MGKGKKCQMTSIFFFLPQCVLVFDGQKQLSKQDQISHKYIQYFQTRCVCETLMPPKCNLDI